MSSQRTLIQALKALLPLVPKTEKRRFRGLLALTVVMALGELVITGLVALLAAVFGSPEAVLNSRPALWLREVFGADFGNDARYLALAILCAVLFTIICKNALTVLQQWQMTAFSESAAAAAKDHLLRFYLRAPFLWVLRTGTSEMFFGLAATNSLGATLTTALQICANFLMILTVFCGLVAAAPLPSLMFLTVLGVGGTLIVKATRKLLDAKSTAAYRAVHAAHGVQQTAVHGLKEIRLYGREENFAEAHKSKLAEIRHAVIRQQAFLRLPVSSLEILGFLTLVGVLLFLIMVRNAGMATIAGIMGFMAAAAWRTLPVANRLVDSLSQLRAALPYLNKAADLITLEKSMAPQLLPPFGQQGEPTLFERDIRLENICFRYPDAGVQAVRNISFTINAGQMVGLVGLSGAGKSTLVNILTGLIPPETGRLLVDDKEITKENARSWLGRIGYVAQAPYILNASLAENVAFSRWGEEIDKARVLECCRMAALDFVDDLEQGIDTVLGDRGTRLSGGQAQRVAIARALYSKPDLIIFDEATSALDMMNEKAVHDTILSLRDRVTMVIIAHRLTTVEGCDTLVWMEKGEVYRSGPVREVLEEYSLRMKEASHEG